MIVARGREQHQRIDRPVRRNLKEGIARDRFLIDEERGLAGIAQQQRRQHDAVPSPADRALAEVAHIRVQGLAPGDAQEHAAKDHEPAAPRMNHEPNCVARIERRDDAGMMRDRHHAERRDDHEPEQHHGSECAADFFRAEALRGEQAEQNDHRHRHYEGLECRGDHIHTL